jgi:hypothetical protein
MILEWKKLKTKSDNILMSKEAIWNRTLLHIGGRKEILSYSVCFSKKIFITFTNFSLTLREHLACLRK